ncbi:reverse transcriptase domain-containing protein [Tanacetum coccineum]
MINPVFRDQLVIIGGGLPSTCKDQLKLLLKDNTDVFAWEPADMIGVPRRIIEHHLNVNTSVEPEQHKRRVLAPEKSKEVTRNVEEWVKAGIVRLVRCIQRLSSNTDVKGRRGENSVLHRPGNIGRNLEAYVDDIVIKSNNEKMLLADVAETFDNLRKINMKLNPNKCSFGVEEGKFLGYMEMQSLAGKLAALNRFLAKSAKRFLPFFNTLKNITKKNKHEYKWTIEAEEAFQQMKRCIMNLSSLTPPYPKETLYAYLAVSIEAVSFVLLTNRKGKQNPVQYVSRTLNESERNYVLVENLALSLVHMTRRLRRNVVKGQVLADFITEKLGEEPPEEYFRAPRVTPKKDVTEEWILFTDGASSSKGSGAGLVLIGPSGIEHTYAIRLTFDSINNEAEYEALLAGLRIAKQMNVQRLEARVNSKLVVSQINGSYVSSSDNMMNYLAKAKEYIAYFKSFSIKNIPRNQNQKADVLSKLALVALNHLTKEVLVEVLNERSTERKEISTIVMEEGDNWMTPIIRCLEKGIWLEDKNEARNLRVKINQYAMENSVLFKKSYLVPMLRCVVHYKQTMLSDAKKEIHKCDSCQIHSAVPKLPKTFMNSIMAPWPFYQWGINILGPLPQASGRIKFGLPRIIVTNNDTQFVNDSFKSWCTRLNVQQMNISVAHPQANRLTSIKTSNGETPFSLAYGSKAVIPTEIGMPTYRTIMIKEGLNEEEIRLNLDLLTERWELAAIREARYKTKLEQYYNKKVHLTSFKPGEFVFRKNKASRVEDQGKLGPKWEGPYRVAKA